ncbi:MAG: D-amino-acid transaminase [Proteobacteria bacterium]|jgi:D-alanine transaminase|nr:D-amino-acid transaminase [Pseudomonadota bacterium]
MKRIVYVNGNYLGESEAKISVFDRGFLFADAIYEVTSVLEGKLIDFESHIKRLDRSLEELGLFCPISTDELLLVHRELMQRNQLTEGCVYMQISRGVADRDFAYSLEVEPTLVLFTQAKSLIDSTQAKSGIKVISVEDKRWGRRDIKTVQLLYPSMCKMMAIKAGADDAWLVQDGTVTEGTSNNAYIVKNRKIITRSLGNEILHGITRAAILMYAKSVQMEVEERTFTIDEVISADEAFITSATSFVTPVVEMDGQSLGDGTPGPVAVRLREIYIEESLRRAI